VPVTVNLTPVTGLGIINAIVEFGYAEDGAQSVLLHNTPGDVRGGQHYNRHSPHSGLRTKEREDRKVD
jgi:hypothetical protein